VKKEQVRARIEEIGIVAAIRVSKSDDAYYAAETVYNAGIPVAEITMTVPGAIDVISDLATRHPDMVVGAGTVLDQETARRCVDAGAKFLTSPGLVLDVVDFALKNDVVVFPGVLTATEVIMAWKAGVDFIKIFPCAQVGGDRYIRALKVPFPNVPLIA
jgi:2-dehydro-3-deoxyphosphogluconate aldolase/(4S)-4-hydroxy-2-oxoglutarate aldolase